MKRVMGAVGATGLYLLGVGPSAGAATGDGRVLVIADSRVTESSGLVASSRHAGVYWTHNDSGGKAELFAVGPDGRIKATITLAGVEALDWEAMAPGRDERGAPALFVGDIGDNKAERKTVSIYRIPEPETLRDATVTPVRYTVAYEDGPRDAEALLVHPATGRVGVASKELFGPGLYASTGPLREGVVNTLTRVAKAPVMVTDGAYSPDGTRFILRGYLDSDMYSAPGVRVGRVDTPAQKQGESVTFSPDGSAVVFGSEGANSALWRVVLTGANRPDPVRAPAPAPPSAAAPPADTPGATPGTTRPAEPETAPSAPTPGNAAPPVSPPISPPASPNDNTGAPTSAASVGKGSNDTDAWIWVPATLGGLALIGVASRGLLRRSRPGRD